MQRILTIQNEHGNQININKRSGAVIKNKSWSKDFYHDTDYFM